MNDYAMNNPHADCWNRIGVRGDHSCELLGEHGHCRHCGVYSSAAAQVMQRPLSQAYLQEWAGIFAHPQEEDRRSDQSALIFRIGSEWLALPTRLALAVADPRAPHRLPHRSAGPLLGIVGIQGRIYPCMSLAALLGIADEEPTARPGQRVYPRLLLMQFGRQAFALPVDDLQGMHRHASNQLQPLPATLAESRHRYMRGLLVLDERRIGCLDEELIGHQLNGALR